MKKILNFIFETFIMFFKENNDINEKNVVGALSFLVMVIFATFDIITGRKGQEFIVNEFIYNSFLIVTLGCFGITSVENIFKYINKKNNNDI